MRGVNADKSKLLITELVAKTSQEKKILLNDCFKCDHAVPRTVPWQEAAEEQTRGTNPRSLRCWGLSWRASRGAPVALEADISISPAPVSSYKQFPISMWLLQSKKHKTNNLCWQKVKKYFQKGKRVWKRGWKAAAVIPQCLHAFPEPWQAETLLPATCGPCIPAGARAPELLVAPGGDQGRSPCGGTAPADPSVSPSPAPPASKSRGLELFISSLPGGTSSKAIRLLWQFYGA